MLMVYMRLLTAGYLMASLCAPAFAQSAEDLLISASQKASSQDLEEALRELDRAIILKPGFADAYFLRAEVYDNLGRVKESLADYEVLARLSPEDPLIYFNRAVVRERIQEEGSNSLSIASLKDYDRAIKLNADFAEAFFNRAVLKSRLGDKTGSTRDFSRALALNPGLQDPFMAQGYKQFSAQNYREAIELYTQAIELNPDNALAYINRGLSKAKIGDLDPAILDLEEAKRLYESQSKYDEYLKTVESINQIREFKN